MKKVVLFIGSLLVVTLCFAYPVGEIQEQTNRDAFKLEEKLDARLPATSLAQVGQVNKRKIELTQFSQPIFILGGDPFSFDWLKKHAEELEEKHALGFITNIDSSSRLEEFQRLANVPLLPANVDDLLAIFHEKHYPLILHGDELWQ
ncbi:PFL_4695 family integrating conjugative element protein [Legionella sp. CNM-1927-20]|uniref:PFL_4695 family integrating conjugative element protein n=1 Tax=Legionella sp. CNM-1927-20 TaxID=3422221 RepID=UPI00403AFD7E